MVRTAILSVTGTSATGRREDRTVRAVREVLASGPFVEVDYQVVPDEQAMIRSRLRILTEAEGVDLVLTTGGAGLALRDRAPEATLEVVERTIPGLAEAMRAGAAGAEPRAWLSRAVAGVRRETVVVNLPGSPDGARGALSAVVTLLPEAVDEVQRGSRAAQPPGGSGHRG